MQRHSQDDRYSQDRYQPGYGQAGQYGQHGQTHGDLGAGYRGSQDEHALAPGYMQGGQGQPYQRGVSSYQNGGYHNSYQGGGYDRSQRGGYDRDDSRGGSYGRGYDQDRDAGRGYAFQHNDYDRNDGGYQRGVAERHAGDRGDDRGGYSAYSRDIDQSFQRGDERGRGYNMYSRDVDASRRDSGRHDAGYDRPDFYARDDRRGGYDRGDFDRQRSDRGMSGGYHDRGSYGHDRDTRHHDFDNRDFGRSGRGMQPDWRGHHDEARSGGGYQGAPNDRGWDDRFSPERRWR